jgi:RecB family endonuclease NucS
MLIKFVSVLEFMLKKVDNKWQFASENNLEDFVWSRLNSLLGLSGLKRQYRVYGDTCDILAIDENSRLVILELKNAEDRYIVQQLTRYYHSLLEEKPFQQQVNYELPIRLIAVAPSFHYHNWIDKKYHQLSFEFMAFTLNQQHNEVYLQLQNLDTFKTIQTTVLNVSLIQKTKVSQCQNSVINESEDGTFVFTKAIDDILSYYVLVKHAHNLGIPELKPSEIERLNNLGFPNKVSKRFKIKVKETRAKSGYREISIRVPSSINVGTFVIWVQQNVSTAIGVVSPTGGRNYAGFYGRMNN